MNKEIHSAQSQLQDAKKLLKLDPGNTELLAQKHKLLGQTVPETKEKPETLIEVLTIMEVRNGKGSDAIFFRFQKKDEML